MQLKKAVKGFDLRERSCQY
jgi:hypothetical protein